MDVSCPASLLGRDWWRLLEPSLHEVVGEGKVAGDAELPRGRAPLPRAREHLRRRLAVEPPHVLELRVRHNLLRLRHGEAPARELARARAPERPRLRAHNRDASAPHARFLHHFAPHRLLDAFAELAEPRERRKHPGREAFRVPEEAALAVFARHEREDDGVGPGVQFVARFFALALKPPLHRSRARAATTAETHPRVPADERSCMSCDGKVGIRKHAHKEEGEHWQMLQPLSRRRRLHLSGACRDIDGEAPHPFRRAPEEVKLELILAHLLLCVVREARRAQTPRRERELVEVEPEELALLLPVERPRENATLEDGQHSRPLRGALAQKAAVLRRVARCAPVQRRPSKGLRCERSRPRQFHLKPSTPRLRSD
mmetsp:Transcript_21833/g.70515  ORF Transcript_21833/g.70515 Transcript_21833/m.70515 type:complete len:373 (-) Transcript_21833:61-1179(-)